MDGQLWTDALLEPMRAVGDPPADQVIEAVIEEGGEPELRRTLATLVSNDGVALDELPPVVRDYFQSTDGLPDWADPAQVALGEDCFVRHGIEMSAVLLCASLPFCYADAKGVNVLYLSAQLTKFVERRIVETTQFMLDLMAPGGLLPDGPGVRSAQKVRMLHATMRYVMKAHADWNDAWGFPLNQEDLALTLMTFACVVPDGLKKLNIVLSDEEEAAYFHVWRVAGHLMGVQPQLIPADIASGRALFEVIGKRQYAPSDAGKFVTAALVHFLERMIPGTIFDGFAPVKIRYLIGDELADMLDVPQKNWTQILMPPLRLFLGLTQDMEQDAAIRRLTSLFGRELLHGLQRVDRGGGRPMFHVPTALQAHWNIA